jgi:hypothetical protein
MDYFWDEQHEQPSYIDANPRITEPMNGVVNGINLADLQVQLSLNRDILSPPPLNPGFKSHNTIQALMGTANHRHARRDVLREMYRVLFSKNIYKGSQEGMIPIRHDLPSILPLALVFADLLLDPKRAQQLAQKTIANYSLGSAIPKLAIMDPQCLI